jgi:hypothetical protein
MSRRLLRSLAHKQKTRKPFVGVMLVLCSGFSLVNTLMHEFLHFSIVSVVCEISDQHRTTSSYVKEPRTNVGPV